MTFALIIGVLLVLSILLTLDGSWMNVLQGVRNSTVFADRNQEYGAFELRRDYNRRLAVALLGSVLFLGLAVGAPKIIASFKDAAAAEKKEKIVDVTLSEFADEPPPPPPPPEVIPPPQPKIEEVKFVDVEASDEKQDEPPPAQTDLVETNISTQNVEGEKGDVAPPEVEAEPAFYDYNAVQEQASPPGGLDKWRQGLADKFVYPPIDEAAGTQGKVWVEFLVDKDGSLTDVKVLRGLSPGLDKEALRVVKASPKWTAAKMNGHEVRVRYRIPIDCALE